MSKAGLATWEMLRDFLQQALGSFAEDASIPLSNLKRLFRSKHHAELSETALGYTKLSELLQDPRVRDVCSVRLQSHSYAIFPPMEPVGRSQISLADSLFKRQHPGEHQ